MPLFEDGKDPLDPVVTLFQPIAFTLHQQPEQKSGLLNEDLVEVKEPFHARHP